MNISLAAEPLFHIGSFAITNTLVMAWLTVLLVFVVVIALRGKLRAIPKGLQNILEYLFEGFLGLIDSITGSKKLSKEFFPLILTIFIFVLLSNWIEIIPGLGTIGIWGIHHGHEVLIPFIRSTSADLNFTIALALISVGAAQYYGIKHLGTFKYIGKFLPFKGLFVVKKGITIPSFNGFINFFVGLLEIVSELAKVMSFSFRLFGNIFAGEALLLVVTTLVPYFIPLPFLFLEIFVGVVQALVFAMLTLVFLKIATTSHDTHEAH